MRQIAGRNSCRFDGEEMTWVKTIIIETVWCIWMTIFLFSAPFLARAKKRKIIEE